MLFGLLVFAILFTSAALDYLVAGERRGTPLDRQDGSLSKSLLTEYMAITGGFDWGETLKLLNMIHPIWVGVFLIYHFFFFLAFMNIITGVFCHGAIESATSDADHVMETHIESVEKYAQRLKEMFQDMDTDGSGTINLLELEEHLKDPIVKAYFSALDIDPSATWTLFTLLDSDGTNEIDLEEFIIGCLRLKGQARSTDMVRLGYEMKWLGGNLKTIAKSVHNSEQQMSELRAEHQLMKASNARKESSMCKERL